MVYPSVQIPILLLESAPGYPRIPFLHPIKTTITMLITIIIHKESRDIPKTNSIINFAFSSRGNLKLVGP